jgi:hypothetical protein
LSTGQACLNYSANQRDWAFAAQSQPREFIPCKSYKNNKTV